MTPYDALTQLMNNIEAMIETGILPVIIIPICMGIILKGMNLMIKMERQSQYLSTEQAIKELRELEQQELDRQAVQRDRNNLLVMRKDIDYQTHNGSNKVGVVEDE